jgi:hypothetical protein
VSATTEQPTIGVCARCGQTRPVFQPEESWGRVRGPLCSPDWQKYADARASRDFVDFKDAFDNATDEELYERLEAHDRGGR